MPLISSAFKSGPLLVSAYPSSGVATAILQPQRIPASFHLSEIPFAKTSFAASLFWNSSPTPEAEPAQGSSSIESASAELKALQLRRATLTSRLFEALEVHRTRDAAFVEFLESEELPVWLERGESADLGGKKCLAYPELNPSQEKAKFLFLQDLQITETQLLEDGFELLQSLYATDVVVSSDLRLSSRLRTQFLAKSGETLDVPPTQSAAFTSRVGVPLPGLQNHDIGFDKHLSAMPHQIQLHLPVRERFSLLADHAGRQADIDPKLLEINLVSPTGAGKTRNLEIAAAEAFRTKFASDGDKIFIYSHTRSIGKHHRRTQARLSRVLRKILGRPVRFSRFDASRKNFSGDVVFVSIPTAFASHHRFFTLLDAALAERPGSQVILQAVDEIHHLGSGLKKKKKMWPKVFSAVRQHSPRALRLGFTGTPSYEEGSILARIHESELILSGVLPRRMLIKTQGVDLDTIGIARTEDFLEEELSLELLRHHERNEHLYRAFENHGLKSERPAPSGAARPLSSIGFGVTLKHAQMLAEDYAKFFSPNYQEPFPDKQSFAPRPATPFGKRNLRVLGGNDGIITLEQLKTAHRDYHAGAIDGIVAVVSGKTAKLKLDEELQLNDPETKEAHSVLDWILNQAHDVVDGKPGAVEAVFTVNALAEGSDLYMFTHQFGARPTLSRTLKHQERGRISRHDPSDVDRERGILLRDHPKLYFDVIDRLTTPGRALTHYGDGLLGYVDAKYGEIFDVLSAQVIAAVDRNALAAPWIPPQKAVDEPLLFPKPSRPSPKRRSVGEAKVLDWSPLAAQLEAVLDHRFQGQIPTMARRLRMAPEVVRSLLQGEGWDKVSLAQMSTLLGLDRNFFDHHYERSRNALFAPATQAEHELLQAALGKIATLFPDLTEAALTRKLSPNLNFGFGNLNISRNLNSSLKNLNDFSLSPNAFRNLASSLATYFHEELSNPARSDDEKLIALEMRDLLTQAILRRLAWDRLPARLSPQEGRLLVAARVQAARYFAGRPGTNCGISGLLLRGDQAFIPWLAGLGVGRDAEAGLRSAIHLFLRGTGLTEAQASQLTQGVSFCPPRPPVDAPQIEKIERLKANSLEQRIQVIDALERVFSTTFTKIPPAKRNLLLAVRQALIEDNLASLEELLQFLETCRIAALDLLLFAAHQDLAPQARAQNTHALQIWLSESGALSPEAARALGEQTAFETENWGEKFKPEDERLRNLALTLQQLLASRVGGRLTVRKIDDTALNADTLVAIEQISESGRLPFPSLTRPHGLWKSLAALLEHFGFDSAPVLDAALALPAADYESGGQRAEYLQQLHEAVVERLRLRFPQKTPFFLSQTLGFEKALPKRMERFAKREAFLVFTQELVREWKKILSESLNLTTQAIEEIFQGAYAGVFSELRDWPKATVAELAERQEPTTLRALTQAALAETRFGEVASPWLRVWLDFDDEISPLFSRPDSPFANLEAFYREGLGGLWRGLSLPESIRERASEEIERKICELRGEVFSPSVEPAASSEERKIEFFAFLNLPATPRDPVERLRCGFAAALFDLGFENPAALASLKTPGGIAQHLLPWFRSEIFTAPSKEQAFFYKNLALYWGQIDPEGENELTYTRAVFHLYGWETQVPEQIPDFAVRMFAMELRHIFAVYLGGYYPARSLRDYEFSTPEGDATQLWKKIFGADAAETRKENEDQLLKTLHSLLTTASIEGNLEFRPIRSLTTLVFHFTRDPVKMTTLGSELVWHFKRWRMFIPEWKVAAFLRMVKRLVDKVKSQSSVSGESHWNLMIPITDPLRQATFDRSLEHEDHFIQAYYATMGKIRQSQFVPLVLWAATIVETLNDLYQFSAKERNNQNIAMQLCRHRSFYRFFGYVPANYPGDSDTLNFWLWNGEHIAATKDFRAKYGTLERFYRGEVKPLLHFLEVDAQLQDDLIEILIRDPRGAVDLALSERANRAALEPFRNLSLPWKIERISALERLSSLLPEKIDEAEIAERHSTELVQLIRQIRGGKIHLKEFATHSNLLKELRNFLVSQGVEPKTAASVILRFAIQFKPWEQMGSKTFKGILNRIIDTHLDPTQNRADALSRETFESMRQMPRQQPGLFVNLQEFRKALGIVKRSLLSHNGKGQTVEQFTRLFLTPIMQGMGWLQEEDEPRLLTGVRSSYLFIELFQDAPLDLGNYHEMLLLWLWTGDLTPVLEGFLPIDDRISLLKQLLPALKRKIGKYISVPTLETDILTTIRELEQQKNSA